MADTRLLEQTGEAYIIHQLCRYKLLLLKPYFYRNGVDLIILSDVSPSARIAVLQSKYRSVTEDRGSNVSIPCKYVRDRFFAFLYVENSTGHGELYVFYPEHIREWNEAQGLYVLNIPKSQQLSSFQVDHLFSERDAARIRDIVEHTESSLSLDSLILAQNAVLSSTFQNWRIHGIPPSPGELITIDEDEWLFLNATPEQLAWAFAYSYLASDDLVYHTFEYCFHELARLHNNDRPLVSAGNVGSVTFLDSGCGTWDTVYPRYIIAVMEIGSPVEPARSITGLYAMISNAEGEGLEFFIPRDPREQLLIRHMSTGAKPYVLKTMDTLQFKYEQKT